MLLIDTHQHYFRKTLELALLGKGTTNPNPAVGAIVVKNGRVVGTGYHAKAGQAHAEPQALAMAGALAAGADLYVSLEPCSHTGRTLPCTEAIIAAGIKRVYFAVKDNNSQVSGAGQNYLQQHGIACQQITVPSLEAFYQGYRYFNVTKRPYVTGKIAMMLDGSVAGAWGEPWHITGSRCNQYTHVQRQQTDAILTSAKTLLQDNPQLNCRLAKRIIAKTVIVLDSSLKLASPEAAQLRVFETARQLIVLHNEQVPRERQEVLRERGVNCIVIPSSNDISQRNTDLDLTAVVNYLGQQGFHDVWLEAGPTLWHAFRRQKLFNHWLLYIHGATPQQAGISLFQQIEKFPHEDDETEWIICGSDVILSVKTEV